MRLRVHIVSALCFTAPVVAAVTQGDPGLSEVHVRPGMGIVEGGGDANLGVLGTPTAPFQLFEAAMSYVEEYSAYTDTLVLHGGEYQEIFVLDVPMTVRGASGEGPAVVRRPTSKKSTTLTVLTYNTHLFGNAGPSFLDVYRAQEIANVLASQTWDLVSLNEVWTSEVRDIIVQGAGYPHHVVLSGSNCFGPLVPGLLGSGLLVLSKHPISGESFTPYWSAKGEELLACKGYGSFTLHLDHGFEIGIIQTHTAGNDGEIAKLQIKQLEDGSHAWQAANLDKELILLGDLNVNGINGNEAHFVCDELGLNDSHMHMSGYSPASGYWASFFDDPFNIATFSGKNSLYHCFACEGDVNKKSRIDYALHSTGTAYHVIPNWVHIDTSFDVPVMQGNCSLCNNCPLGTCSGITDLSDHFPVEASYDLVEL